MPLLRSELQSSAVFKGQACLAANSVSYSCQWESIPVSCPGYTLFALQIVTERGGSIHGQLNKVYSDYWQTVDNPRQDSAQLSFNIQVIHPPPPLAPRHFGSATVTLSG